MLIHIHSLFILHFFFNIKAQNVQNVIFLNNFKTLVKTS